MLKYQLLVQSASSKDKFSFNQIEINVDRNDVISLSRCVKLSYVCVSLCTNETSVHQQRACLVPIYRVLLVEVRTFVPGGKKILRDIAE